MKYLNLLIIAVACCFGGCAVSLVPIGLIVERSLIEDVSGQVPKRFPIIVQPEGKNGSYTIDSLDTAAPSELVTELSEETLERINADLRSHISDDSSSYNYFRVKKRGDGFIDVQLEVPTRKDSVTRSWYRIQDGEIIPQRRLNYFGPGLVFLTMPWAILAGLLTSLIVTVLTFRAWPKQQDRYPGKRMGENE